MPRAPSPPFSRTQSPLPLPSSRAQSPPARAPARSPQQPYPRRNLDGRSHGVPCTQHPCSACGTCSSRCSPRRVPRPVALSPRRHARQPHRLARASCASHLPPSLGSPLPSPHPSVGGPHALPIAIGGWPFEGRRAWCARSSRATLKLELRPGARARTRRGEARRSVDGDDEAREGRGGERGKVCGFRTRLVCTYVGVRGLLCIRKHAAVCEEGMKPGAAIRSLGGGEGAGGWLLQQNILEYRDSEGYSIRGVLLRTDINVQIWTVCIGRRM